MNVYIYWHIYRHIYIYIWHLPYVYIHCVGSWCLTPTDSIMLDFAYIYIYFRILNYMHHLETPRARALLTRQYCALSQIGGRIGDMSIYMCRIQSPNKSHNKSHTRSKHCQTFKLVTSSTNLPYAPDTSRYKYVHTLSNSNSKH